MIRKNLWFDIEKNRDEGKNLLHTAMEAESLSKPPAME